MKQIILIFAFLGALTGASTTLFLYSKLVKEKNIIKPQEKSSLLSDSSAAFDTQNSKKLNNILLLGYGGAGHDGGYLSDTIIVLSIDPENKKFNLISIPRDLWIALPVDWDYTINAKINEAYSAGGNDTRYANKKPEFRGEKGRGEMAKFAAGIVLGMPIDYFIAIDFSNLIKTIDLLGGIEVNVPVAFDDYFYPVKGKENETCGKSASEIALLHQKYSGFNLEKQFECRYEHLHFEKGNQTMNGETVLKFVRSRHSDNHGGDFARSVRQFEALQGIKNKIITLQIIENVDPVFDRLYQSVKTDIDIVVIKSLLSVLGDYKSYSLKQINLTEENVLVQSKGPQGQFILIPKSGVNNWEEVNRFIKSSIDK